MVVKWNFTDPTDSSTAQFEVNPNDGGTLPYDKNVLHKSTVVANGKTIIFEGARPPAEMVFSGTILTQTMLDMIVLWFNKEYAITVTDDLNRTFSIFITKFEPKRVRAAHTPWKHTYTVTATILDW